MEQTYGGGHPKTSNREKLLSTPCLREQGPQNQRERGSLWDGSLPKPQCGHRKERVGGNICYSLPLSSRSAPLGPNQKASKAGLIEVSFPRHSARQRHQKKGRDCVSVQIQRNQSLQGHASHYEDIQKRHSCLNPESSFQLEDVNGK